ncbi:hypothetical protein [Kineococcus sp. SYSU DK005]|uniref:hypothetical protein n=1 Tax=Kineococcus sp. SYSU DK005 TaxID=3383126 RepID=UPI003D7EF66B
MGWWRFGRDGRTAGRDARGGAPGERAPGAPAAPAPPSGTAPGPGFLSTATGLAEALVAETGYSTWFVNRVVAGTHTVLAGASTKLRVPTGMVTALTSTPCDVTVAARGPVIARDVDRSPDLADDKSVVALEIRAYAGTVLLGPTGEPIGTVCGLSREPVGEGATPSPQRLRADAETIAASLARELEGMRALREADRAAALAHHADELTGLPDRRGFGLLLSREEDRARTWAEPSGIVLLDVGAVSSARLVRRAALAAREAAGGDGAVVRLGGRQLGVLCAGAGVPCTEVVAERVRSALTAAGCAATAGWSVREPFGGLVAAWQRAEESLLAARRAAVTV